MRPQEHTAAGVTNLVDQVFLVLLEVVKLHVFRVIVVLAEVVRGESGEALRRLLQCAVENLVHLMQGDHR